MKIILLEDVKALGKAGEIVEVSNGYARNMLLPKKLGVEATSKNLNDLKLKKAHQEKVAAENLADAKDLAKQLSGAVITIPIKTGENGKVFGSVSAKEIAEAVKKQCGIDAERPRDLADVLQRHVDSALLDSPDIRAVQPGNLGKLLLRKSSGFAMFAQVGGKCALNVHELPPQAWKQLR